MHNLRKRIKNAETVLGSWITLAHPAVAEIMCRAGFDWLAVDMEHSVITIREAEELIRIIDLSGAAPLVRLSDNDPVQIKRVMDAGAEGVIVPMVNTPEQAAAAAAALRYPPTGVRGVGLARAQGYGSDFPAYRDALEDDAVLIVQVEHKDAVDNLEAILTTPGVDGFIVGPYDLSGSFGVPGAFDDPRMKKAMARIREVALDLGARAGIHVIEPDPGELARRIGQGYTFVAYSLDIRMLDASARRGLARVRP